MYATTTQEPISLHALRETQGAQAAFSVLLCTHQTFLLRPPLDWGVNLSLAQTGRPPDADSRHTPSKGVICQMELGKEGECAGQPHLVSGLWQDQGMATCQTISILAGAAGVTPSTPPNFKCFGINLILQHFYAIFCGGTQDTKCEALRWFPPKPWPRSSPAQSCCIMCPLPILWGEVVQCQV